MLSKPPFWKTSISSPLPTTETNIQDSWSRFMFRQKINNWVITHFLSNPCCVYLTNPCQNQMFPADEWDVSRLLPDRQVKKAANRQLANVYLRRWTAPVKNAFYSAAKSSPYWNLGMGSLWRMYELHNEPIWKQLGNQDRNTKEIFKFLVWFIQHQLQLWIVH